MCSNTETKYRNKRVDDVSEQTIKLQRIKRRVEATDTDLSGSVFTDVSLAGTVFKDVNLAGATIDDASLSSLRVQNVNLSGLRISQANLTGASIVDCLTSGMTIGGIAVADLMAAYRTANRLG
jgi:uncharacterized protein YjbI with pentapeptide repeats